MPTTEVETKTLDEEVVKDGTRLDQRSKIALMAAIIFSTQERQDIKRAVDDAFALDREVGDKLRQIRYTKKRASERKPLTPSLERVYVQRGDQPRGEWKEEKSR